MGIREFFNKNKCDSNSVGLGLGYPNNQHYADSRQAHDDALVNYERWGRLPEGEKKPDWSLN
ncbi:hypothetical protein COW86_02380 [Candidatus Kuenenbacteria bacterium CG22_combo_CG10-13_8_21_14_all_39_9]|uniref:Uncharacterized protein n=1 Tax=Candidatus Kuenenbacteria bacterium CG22_combo_CG10-13_8_21_14_all_39_9 TaxID=1974621 RepID=A0A2H0D0K2_9BACT|nr:MAG: hypothetical protein COW86_02380 [Candidatus Kuenenbacteria bacterium CG22_combo_CG10-13_8_21_14_all_39_9]